jgi:4-hydroxybenzoate polyprenyltransferase
VKVRDEVVDGPVDLGAPGNRAGGSIEQRYARWGVQGPRAWRLLLAHVRTTRPTTRLWLDTLMPLALIAVLTEGAMPVRITVFTVAAMNLLHIGATLLNDVKDRDTDRLSNETLRRSRPITTGLIGPKLALGEAVVCVLVGLCLTALVRWQLTAVTVVLALLITQHELPPVRTQGRPVVSQIAGLTGLVGIVTAIVVAVGVIPPWRLYAYLLFVVIYLGLGEMLVKDIRDCDNDAKGGKLTTAVKYGPAAATVAASIAYSCAAACWIWFTAEAPPGIAPVWLLIGAAVLAGWIALTVSSARKPRSSFDKVVARRLHRGSAVTFSITSAALLAGYLL